MIAFAFGTSPFCSALNICCWPSAKFVSKIYSIFRVTGIFKESESRYSCLSVIISLIAAILVPNFSGRLSVGCMTKTLLSMILVSASSGISAKTSLSYNNYLTLGSYVDSGTLVTQNIMCFNAVTISLGFSNSDVTVFINCVTIVPLFTCILW